MPRLGSLSSRSLSGIGVGAALSKVVKDTVSGTIYTATVGNITGASTPVKFTTNSLSFNGSSKTEIAIPSTSTLTVECWAYATALNGAPFALASSNNQVINVFLSSTVSTYWNDTTITYGASTTLGGTISTGTWYWIVLQMTNTHVDVWVNGVQQANADFTNVGGQDYRQAAKTKLIIGGYTYGVSQALTGYVDYIRVSNVLRYSGTTLSVPTFNPGVDSSTVALITSSLAGSVNVTPATRAFTVAQSSSSGIYTSNGTTWTETTMPVSTFWVDSSYNPANPGRAVAIAWSSSNVAYSSDYGQTWTAGTGLVYSTWNAVAPVTSTVWVAVSDTAVSSSSNNGQTWTAGTGATGTGAAGIGGGLAVIVNNSLTYYTTTNGTSFTTRTFPTNPSSYTTFTRIEYINGYYVVMQGSNGRYIMTSTDGINWTVQDVTGGLLRNFRDISFGGVGTGTYIIVCDLTATYYTSGDLATWTARTFPTSRRWAGITWINNQWVATVDGTSIKAVSTDGINWTESTLVATDRRWMDLTEVR